MAAVQLIASVFRGGGQEGDFGWMIHQPAFADALFVFNDNEEQFLAHQRDGVDPYGCAAGDGNAVIRPFQCQSPPRAAGIPTGSHGDGYIALTPAVKEQIDAAIEVIAQLVQTGSYQRVYYSSDGTGGLGTGIFQVGRDVKEYIVQQLERVV